MFRGKILVFFWLCFCRLDGVCAGTDELKSVMEGESVSLNTNLTEIQKGEEIKWKFGPKGNLIAETDGVNKRVYDDVLDGRFKERLKLDNKTGSLTIMNIRTDHTGVYEVEFSSSSSSSTHRFTVTVSAATTPDPPTTSDSPSPPSSGSPSHPSSGSPGPSSGSPSPSSGYPSSDPGFQTALISAAAASGFLLIVAVVGMICICKKHRKTDKAVETREEEITYADPTFYKRNAQKSEDEVVYAAVVPRR